MIIDSHTHIGTILNFDMQTKTLLDSMNKYQIDFCLVSNVESAEFDHQQHPIPKEFQKPQIESCKQIIAFARTFPKQIGALLWVKPTTERVDQELEDLIKNNREFIYGLKFHPYHSKIAFDDPKVQAYFKLARQYDLPIVTHTASDNYSAPRLVFEMAKKYPDIKFVMVHLGLGTDHKEAIGYLAKLPNLYGDSTWVAPDKVIEAIKLCGSQKVMFGTDSPINGIDTYNDENFYQYYFNDMKDEVDLNTYELFMGGNAKRIFKI